ncbi:MAG: response regulator transcription factor [Candidatus Eremiobacteraeota bacterium]|nr:response regulator transcription factor [Candidatus Eremiobacteraeota bacterium]MCW5871494.1 response regulator transcription factor [Candidatus Eremiobacteraeota bacterium]
MIRAILVEDQSLVRASLASILISNGVDVVAETMLGAEAVQLVERHRPDLMLLDLALVDMDGVQVLRDLRMRDLKLPVLVVTGAGTAYRLRSSMEAGANGFLPKTASPEELVKAVRVVVAGGRYLAPGIARDSAGHITERQQRILEGVVYGLTNDQIAARLLVSRGTVKLEINALFQTLRCAGRTHLACEAAIQGLVTMPREQHPLYKDAV